ncbi:MAG: 2,3-bisphosphoglycerate-independent phosphoglycerate mutase [Thermoplasmata archaeon]
MPGRILMVVCDGLGDRPVESMGRRTPLQAARKPNLNWLASRGACGILDIIGPGVRPGSDTAHLALFGHDPFRVYTGRGPFEALGVGLEVRPGDVAFRCNFATVDESMTVLDRRAGRIREGTKELARALDGWELDGVQVFFKEGTEHRGVLLLRGSGLSPNVSDADPHREGLRVAECVPKSPEADLTARVVAEFVRRSHELLKNHPVNRARVESGLPPANIVLPRGAGVVPRLPTLHERYGLRSAAIAGVALVKGICRFSGMDVLDVGGATGGLDTDVEAKMKAALRAIDKNELVFVHIKAPDLCGHDGDAPGKAQVVTRIDDALALVRREVPGDTVVAITSDHSTPVSVRDHSADPVPLLIYGPGVRRDAVRTFDEVSCARGGLGRLLGRDLLPILLDLTGRAEKFGA